MKAPKAPKTYKCIRCGATGLSHQVVNIALGHWIGDQNHSEWCGPVIEEEPKDA